MDNKKDLRRIISERSSLLKPEYIQMSDEKIFDNLISIPEYNAAETIFIYFSKKSEPDTHRLIEHALGLGKTVTLPRVFGKGIMAAYHITGTDQLQKGALGIMEPPDTARRVDAEDIDLIIVPAVAFDLGGYRLGRGGGYYDRFLSASDFFSIGLAREKLLLDSVPREAHDVPVKCIVTERINARFGEDRTPHDFGI